MNKNEENGQQLKRYRLYSIQQNIMHRD